MEIKGVVFDVDGVLLDSLPEHLRFAADWAEKRNVVLASPVPASQAKFKEAITGHKEISPMRSFLLALGFSEEEAQAARLDYERDFPERPISMFADVERMLTLLRGAGLKLGIVTSNVARVVEPALAAVWSLFEPGAVKVKGLGSDNFDKADALRQIASSFGCHPTQLLVVGDQQSDLEASRSAGASFLGVTYGWGRFQEDADLVTVDSREEIVRFACGPPGADYEVERQSLSDLHDSLTHAREMFTYYAGQRQTTFRYFLLGVTLLVTAFGALFYRENAGADVYLWQRITPAAGLILTLVFYLLDKRNELLVESSERLLRTLEWRLQESSHINEFQSLLFTDASPAWGDNPVARLLSRYVRYEYLFPALFLLAAVLLVLVAWLPTVDTPVQVVPPVVDGPPAQTAPIDAAAQDGSAVSDWLVVGFLFLLVAVAVGILFHVYKGETDPWILRWKAWTAFAVALGAMAAAVNGVVTLIGNARDTIDRAPRVTRIFSIPGLDLTAPDPTVFVLGDGASVLTRPDDDAIATFVVPFLDEAACVEDEQGRWPGTYPAEHAEFLRRLGGDLAECAVPAQPAEVQVLGYASSSPVKNYAACGSAESSMQANMNIANRRAGEVAELLRESLVTSRGSSVGVGVTELLVDVRSWRDPEAMAASRGFNDRLLRGAYSSGRGTLNRRVEIVLLKAPACDGSAVPVPF